MLNDVHYIPRIDSRQSMSLVIKQNLLAPGESATVTVVHVLGLHESGLSTHNRIRCFQFCTCLNQNLENLLFAIFDSEESSFSTPASLPWFLNWSVGLTYSFSILFMASWTKVSSKFLSDSSSAQL